MDQEDIIVIGDRSLLGLQVTLMQLQKIYKEASKATLAAALPGLNRCLDDYKMGENKYEVAGFLAQVGHESALLKYREENLNYSATALRSVFGKYFKTDALAAQYARKPEMIANRVYANRMENGNEASGDGWRYRGKGYIQLTGKRNHRLFAEYRGITIDEACEFLLTDDGAWSSAGWYWQFADLDKYDDSPDLFTKLTKLINGGTNGAAHRKELYDRALKVL